ncbi:ankyrin repeat-containing protein [Tanacetum coccineum]|uniref:Ankyrin repeat-containing protein n=1 Tax=Tanacetum coccineum TaxID=301880 RepID=A0ABQ5CT58_9ASTR
MLIRFQSSQAGSLHEQFFSISQNGTARDYVTTFEKMAAQLPGRRKEEERINHLKQDQEIYGGKEEDVGLNELGERGNGVVSKNGEFGEDIGSELLGERGGEILFGGGESGEGRRL